MKSTLIILLISFYFVGSAVFATGTININTATLSQLEEIIHVGAKTAQKIIDSRPYNSVRDLSRVKGIGDGKYLQDIIDQRLACVDCLSAEVDLSQTTPTLEATSPTPPIVVYPDGLVFNEILPSPKGADETDEWFELFNNNSFSVDLSTWKVKDVTGTITTFKIPAQTTILANSYLVFKRPASKIMLNNDGDGLRLFRPDGTLADSVDFPKAPTAQSYNKMAGLWKWSTALTPAGKNIVSAVETKKDGEPLSKEDDSDKNKNTVVGLANLSQSINLNQETSDTANPWFLFFTVLVITIILAGTVLFIKLNFLKTNVRT